MAVRMATPMVSLGEVEEEEGGMGGGDLGGGGGRESGIGDWKRSKRRENGKNV